MSDYLMPIYNKHAITLDRGDGVWLFDTNGTKYLDALSGIGVCALGHNHPAMTQAITEQAQKLLHAPNTFHTLPQQQLAEKFCTLTGLSKAYFSNSGAEAAEVAIKIAKKFGRDKGIECPNIIVIDEGFHGRSLGAASASGTKNETIFGPLVPGFIHVPYNDLGAIQQAISEHTDVSAILLEPILGKGGFDMASHDYLQGIRKLCDQHDVLMMCDEIQSGMGRTGKLFAYQWAEITPDVVFTAKALGNGIPIGAVLVNDHANILVANDHGSTQGGNPFACQVALTVLEVMARDKLIENAADVGHYFHQQLHAALKDHPLYDGMNGMGLMLGIRLKEVNKTFVQKGLEQGIIFNMAGGGKVIRMLPPLIFTKEHVDLAVEKFKRLFER